MKKSLSDIEQEYDLELNKIVENVKKEKAKRVLLQFPDGLKPYSNVVVQELEARTGNVEFFVWLGTCYGACDTPRVSDSEFDLIVQFGHSPWKK